MDIYIEPARKIITIRQRWKYNWLGDVPLTWSYTEKRDWHNKADKIIWQDWRNKWEIYSFTSDPIFKDLSSVDFTVEFDIQWVLDNPHWTVNVLKRHPGRDFKSNVNWGTSTINLSSIDLKNVVREGKYSQNTFQHEYAHTFLNDDEYSIEYGNYTVSEFVDDKHALLNIGNELRGRYFNIIDKQLNSWKPRVQFLVKSKL